jgi:hypothetical protein
VQGSLAGNEHDSGEQAGGQQESVGVSLLDNVKNHQARLKEISDALSTSKLVKGGKFFINNETVQVFIVDIDIILSFFKSNQTQIDLDGYVKDTNILRDQLDDSMGKLNLALIAWADSEGGGLSYKDKSDAKSAYQDRLRDCRSLIEFALTLF